MKMNNLATTVFLIKNFENNYFEILNLYLYNWYNAIKGSKTDSCLLSST